MSILLIIVAVIPAAAITGLAMSRYYRDENSSTGKVKLAYTAATVLLVISGVGILTGAGMFMFLVQVSALCWESYANKGSVYSLTNDLRKGLSGAADKIRPEERDGGGGSDTSGKNG